MRISYKWEHAEVTKLAADLALAPAGTDADVALVVRRSANRLTTLWRADARATSGQHGKHYPRAIVPEISGHEAVIRPDPSRPQGGMAFEYGGPTVIRHPNPNSRPQRTVGSPVGQTKPHLSMNKAADIVFPEFQRDVADLAEIRL